MFQCTTQFRRTGRKKVSSCPEQRLPLSSLPTEMCRRAIKLPLERSVKSCLRAITDGLGDLGNTVRAAGGRLWRPIPHKTWASQVSRIWVEAPKAGNIAMARWRKFKTPRRRRTLESGIQGRLMTSAGVVCAMPWPARKRERAEAQDLNANGVPRSAIRSADHSA